MEIKCILIVDDHPLYRKGLETALLQYKPDLIFLNANNGQEAIDLFKINKVDLILMDIRMPVLNGIDATTKIRSMSSDVKIICLSMFDDMYSVVRMLEAGVNGYSIKYLEVSDVHNMINTVIHGGFYISNEVTDHLEKYLTFKEGLDLSIQKQDLSEREIEVLIAICQQLTSKEIAKKLGISVNTVDIHRTHIMEKSLSKNMAGLVLYAIGKGYIPTY